MNTSSKLISCAQHFAGRIATRKEIITWVTNEFKGTNPGGIIPSDYCYNIINQGTPFTTHIFEFLGKDRYRCLGKDFPYSGNITWKGKVVGNWSNGQYTLQDEYLKVLNRPSITRARPLPAKQSIKIPTNSVALAGEYAVLSQLMLRGFDAGLTLGNTKSIDILAFHPGTGRRYEIEVKTNLVTLKQDAIPKSKLFGSYITDWQMDAKHEGISSPTLFYCFVHIRRERIDSTDYKYRFFIVPSKIVAKYVKEEHALWLKTNPDNKDTTRRLFKIGVPGETKVEIETAQAATYEDNWGFKD